MKYLFMILTSLFIISCHDTQHPSEFTKLPPIVKEESVSPTIDRARGSKEALETLARDQEKTIERQQASLARAEAIAAKIRSQIESGELVKQSDVEELQKELDIAKSDNDKLKHENSAFQSKIKELETILQDAKERSIKKDKEVAQKDDRILYLENIVEKEVKSKNDAISQRDKALLEAENAKVYKSWVRNIAIGFILYLLLKNIIASVWPQAQFLRRL